jgi:predicted metal-dependent peptidase
MTTVARVAGYAGPPADLAKLRAARLWVAHQRPYYASVLYRCPVVLDDRIPTFATDAGWRLYLNPVHADRLSVEAYAAELIHEVNHLIRDHAGRARQLGVVTATAHRRWNLAGDAEINDDLLADGLALDHTWVLPATLGRPDDLTAELYYAGLDQLSEAEGGAGGDSGVPGSGGVPRSGHGPSCGSGAGGAAVPGELDPASDGAPAVSAVEATIIRQQVARDVLDHVRNRGTAPGSLVRWAGELLSPRVDWRRELAAAVRAGLAATGQADYSYQRFSRRDGQVPGIRLPGMVRPTPSVAVVIDTSGSMRATDLAVALGELQGIVRSAGVADDCVTALTVDTRVADTRRVTDARQVGVMSRGGTDMRVGIEAAAKLRPRPEVVVVLSDGETPWPERPPAGCRVILGLIGTTRAELRHAEVPSWLRVVEIAPAA